MRILLVNPNLTAAVTETCAAVARVVAAQGTEIVPATGEFGARIINSRAENAIAAHMVLTLVARHVDTVDAVLLAVSYDTALLAAREVLPIPVVGMTEAAIVASSLVSRRFGLVVFGTPGLYRDLVTELGHAERFAGIRSIDTSAASVFSDPDGVRKAVLAAARALATEDEADAVVLCGAAMAGMAAKLRDEVEVPLLDGISCGVPLCEMLVRMGLRAPTTGTLVAPRGRATEGLDPALAALLARR